MDCADPVAEATFWANVLGSAVDETIGDPPHYVVVSPTATGGPWLSFQRVPESKAGKDRLHLDVVVEDLDGGSSGSRSSAGDERPDPTSRSTASGGG